MSLARAFSQLGPMLVEQYLATLPPEQATGLAAAAHAAVDAIADSLQAQEHEAERVSKAKFLADLAVHLIHGQGEITDQQARDAVDTAKVMLDRAIELTGRK